MTPEFIPFFQLIGWMGACIVVVFSVGWFLTSDG
jgi:hypothetical protein